MCNEGARPLPKHLDEAGPLRRSVPVTHLPSRYQSKQPPQFCRVKASLTPWERPWWCARWESRACAVSKDVLHSTTLGTNGQSIADTISKQRQPFHGDIIHSNPASWVSGNDALAVQHPLHHAAAKPRLRPSVHERVVVLAWLTSITFATPAHSGRGLADAVCQSSPTPTALQWRC